MAQGREVVAGAPVLSEAALRAASVGALEGALGAVDEARSAAQAPVAERRRG